MHENFEVTFCSKSYIVSQSKIQISRCLLLQLIEFIHINLRLGCPGSCRKIKTSTSHHTSKFWKTVYPVFDNLKTITYLIIEYGSQICSLPDCCWELQVCSPVRYQCWVTLVHTVVIMSYLYFQLLYLYKLQESSKIYGPRQKSMGRFDWKI